jgi:PAS domain-containing protein
MAFGELLRLRYFELIHAGAMPGLQEMWEQIVAVGELFDYECRLRRHDGEYRFHTMRSAPIKDATGNVLRWTGSGVVSAT